MCGICNNFILYNFHLLHVKTATTLLLIFKSETALTSNQSAKCLQMQLYSTSLKEYILSHLNWLTAFHIVSNVDNTKAWGLPAWAVLISSTLEPTSEPSSFFPDEFCKCGKIQGYSNYTQLLPQPTDSTLSLLTSSTQLFPKFRTSLTCLTTSRLSQFNTNQKHYAISTNLKITISNSLVSNVQRKRSDDSETYFEKRRLQYSITTSSER